MCIEVIVVQLQTVLPVCLSLRQSSCAVEMAEMTASAIESIGTPYHPDANFKFQLSKSSTIQCVHVLSRHGQCMYM